jgi:hypothetical protein
MTLVCAFFSLMVYSCQLTSGPVTFSQTNVATVGTNSISFHRARLIPYTPQVMIDPPNRIFADSLEAP